MSGKIRDKLATVLSVPQEIVSDAPRIIFDSNTRIYIENFKGISEYGSENIKINTGRYTVTVKGERLEIKSMTTEEAVIEGLIKTVDFS